MRNIHSSILAILFLVICINSFSQNNYVRTWNATAPINSPSVLTSSPLSDVKMVTQYYDGLGRPVQLVAKQGSLESSSGNSYDLISVQGYDYAGRNNINYLPYVGSASDGNFKTDGISAQSVFYSNTNILNGQGESGSNAHSLIKYEESPLNRVQASLSSGNNWIGANRGIGNNYWVNTATDDVKMWNVSYSSIGYFGSYSVSTPYATGALLKTAITDENGNQVLEFKDSEGKTILKKVQLTASADDGNGRDYTGWLCTYYIYDDIGNLRAVIQPAGVASLVGNGWSLTSNILDEQCFKYEYDARNRMIMKKYLAPEKYIWYMIIWIAW